MSTPRGYYRIGGRHTAPSPLLFHHEVVRGDSSHGEGSLQTSPLVEGPPLSGEEVFVSWRVVSPDLSSVDLPPLSGVRDIHERGSSHPLPCGSPRAGCMGYSWRGGGRESPPLLSMASPPPTKLCHSAIQRGCGEHMEATRCPDMSQGPPLP